ncbi:MAG: rod shape determining protein RodA [Actinomycetota bacterium]|jgi:rod shape determining protein RodA|nr:rod shape determining protein RodA [Actinomycetota bacterium]
MAMEGLFGEAVDRIGGEPISSRMARKAPIRHLDPSLLMVTLMLATYGVIMVHSTTANSQSAVDPQIYFSRQIAFLIAGVVALLLVSFFDYRYIGSLAPMLYGVTILALILVLTPLGALRAGATRWISLGVFEAQPSELAKVAIIICLAAYLAQRKGEIRGLDVAFGVVMVAVPSVLIYKQPDLGTMMVFVALLGATLLCAGAKVRHFLALGLVGLIGIVVILQAGFLQEYQIQRLTSFLDPNPDVQSVGYNLTQSKIAIGSGGMQGKGLGGKNTQTSLDFVPEQHTDFIFTAVGEQLGFLGSATLLAMFAFLMWRGLRIAAMSRDLFGTLLAAGIVALWAFQIFVNVGMTMGIMPITGIPLPFISYGGSSLITNFVAVGLLLNIHMRRYL